MTPAFEVEECIMQECESAGLEISEDEELASERGYDRAFEVVNPYKDKLEKIKKILKTNIKQWDETQHDPVEEFKLLVEMIDEEKQRGKMAESKKFFRQKKGQWIWIYDKDSNRGRKVEIEVIIKALNEYNAKKLEPIKYFVLKNERDQYAKDYRNFLKKC